MTLLQRVESWTSGSLATQQALFYRCLATLYNSSIHITRALHIMAAQMEHPLFRASLPDIARRVEGGRRLSDAMAQHGMVFPPLHSQLVALGEQTGSLHLILEKLARQAEKATELRSRVRAALTYPLVIFVLALALLIGAPALVFKDLLRLLQEMQVELPWTTQLMVLGSKIMGSPLVLLPLAAIVVALVAGAHMIKSDLTLRRKVEKGVLAVPILGDAIRAAIVCDFTRSLATCYATGIPILKGLELSASAADHQLFQDALLAARDRMRDGAALHEALQASEFFPGMTLHMVAVGEESGRLADMLERVAALAETQVEQTLAIATAAMQPLMLLLIGIVVGFVVIATMSPMLKVVESL